MGGGAASSKREEGRSRRRRASALRLLLRKAAAKAGAGEGSGGAPCGSCACGEGESPTAGGAQARIDRRAAPRQPLASMKRSARREAGSCGGCSVAVGLAQRAAMEASALRAPGRSTRREAERRKAARRPTSSRDSGTAASPAEVVMPPPCRGRPRRKPHDRTLRRSRSRCENEVLTWLRPAEAGSNAHTLMSRRPRRGPTSSGRCRPPPSRRRIHSREHRPDRRAAQDHEREFLVR